MDIDASAMLKDQMEKQDPFVEVTDGEKQLWALIHSKGLLHKEVQDLYRKVRAGYENIILNHEVVELQDVEFCLWKLHYKHIDEYRRRIRQTGAKSETNKSETVQNNGDGHMEGFYSFLSEAIEFYKELVGQFRRRYRLVGEPLLYEKVASSCSVESTRLHKRQFGCHRFFVCLGDLARYRELCKKSQTPNCRWSVSATFYFEATRIYPDSGNAQNQLALLATYVGDDFLALYHCVRSLALKEPFPDAWDNLMLLLEKNRSSDLHSLSSKAHFDFLKPHGESFSETKSEANSVSSNNKELEATGPIFSGKTELWSLLVRMTSFFLIKSSLEEFPCVFASTMRELEVLLTLNDAKLEASLECYSHLDSARRRPYRVLHIVSALVFIIQSLTKIPESSDQKEKMDVQPSDSTKLAWSATFVCMGRLVDRCLKSNDLDGCPLLVAVLVFVEWLCGMLDRADTWNTDEKVTSSMFYFFGAFADLLNQLDLKEGKAKSNDHTPLWEDYELKGFAPMAHAHASLDFPSNCKDMVNRDDSNVTRARRIFHSAIKIVERSSGSPKWISYDKLRRKFYAAESNTISDQTEAAVKKSSSFSDTKESSHRTCEATKGYEEDIRRENLSHPCPRGEDLAVEEEEVILFKPLTRYNSAPICTSLLTDDQVLIEDTSHQEAPSDESLRRATSLYAAQSLAHNFDATNCRSDRPFKQQEPPPKDSATYPTGPPSLSAWVFNRESANDEREKGSRGLRKQELSPIEEIPSAPLEALSISEATDSFIGSSNVSATVHRSPPPYVAPVPSAPLLPDHAAWYRENSSSFPQRVNEVGISEAEGILGASPVGGFSNWSGTRNPYNFGPAIPSLFDGYPPVVGMSSSEWLQQYKNSQFFQRANNHVRPAHFDPPGTLHGHDASRFDLFDRWGNPLVSNQMVSFENPQLHPGSPPVHNTEEQRRENLFLGYQRPSPYGCRAGTELQAEQPLLLRYLKEREWQLQRESQLRGPTYMGN